jgi:hypothetical protein
MTHLSVTPKPSSPRRDTWLFWGGLAAVLLYAAWVNHAFANMSNLAVDETAHLMWLRLTQAGFEPYREVYITYPPGFMLLLQSIWALWPSNTALCWSFFGYSVLSAVAVGLIGRQIAGPLVGVAAAFFMAVTVGSCHILSEQPSITGSLFALWLALVYQRTGRRWLLPLSALSMALSLLTKPQSPFMPVVIGFILMTMAPGANFNPRAFRWRPLVIDLLIWGGALAAALGLTYLGYNLPAILEQTVGQHIAARDALLDEAGYWTSALDRIIEFSTDNLWLLPLMALGLIQSIILKTKYRFTLLLWLGLAIGTVLLNRPLRPKHLSVLLPLFSIWAGLALAFTWQGWHRFKQSGRVRQGTTILGIGLLIAYLLPVLGTISAGWQTGPGDTAGGIPPVNKQPELEFIGKVTTPHDCLLTDDMKLAYWSGRLVPPHLGEISSNRFRSGHLTLAELIATGNQADCQIAATDSRIARFTPAFKQWLEANYLGKFYYDENEFLYVGKAGTTPTPANPGSINLGDVIQYLGYSLEPTPPTPGQPLALTVFWQALAPIEADYTIFVQLRDANNNTKASADHEPFQGVVPTSRWVPGSVIKDVVYFTLPAALPPGDYRLAVGMYRPDTMARLPLSGDTSGENAILLGPIAPQGH